MADPFESWRSSGDTTLSNLLGPRPTASKGLPMDFSFSDILKSASDLLGSQPGSTPYEFGGKVTDKTGSPELGYLANLLALNSGGIPGTGQAGIAFHGSPHSFEKFSLSKIGTGEGAQAYGHGLYFAENPNVAKGYANPGDFTGLDAANFPKRAGSVYKVDIPDEHIAKMLDWDKPLAAQSASVIEGIKKAGLWPGDGAANLLKGGDFYNRLAMYQKLGDEYGKEAYSKALANAGIPGIKYLDQGSRAGGQGTRNFVIFDENIPKIVGKE